MKLKALDIHSFGRLSNKKFELTPGLNVIYGTNESGKSTICSFIEAMLYSYPPRDGDRKKYIPWDKEFSSGALTIDQEGESYTIYRKIAPTPSGDILNVTPPISLSDILPKDRESFRKSILCHEGKASDFGSTSEIDMKISNILSSGDEAISASLAISRLEAAAKTIKPKKGSGGKLYETEKEITRLENELYEASRIKNERREHNEKIRLLSGEIELLTKKKQSLSSLIEKNHPSQTPYEDDIRKTREKILSFEKTGEIPKKKKPSLPLLLICAVLILLSAASGIFLNPLLFLLLIPFSAALFTYLFFIFRQNKRLLKSFLSSTGCNSLYEYERCLDENTKLKEQLGLLLEKQNAFSSSLYHSDNERRKELEKVNDSIFSLTDRLISLKSSFFEVSCREEGEILSELSYYRSLKKEYEEKLLAIQYAISALTYAKDYLSKHLTPLVSKRAMEYLEKIAPKQSRSISLKEDFSLFLTDPLPQSISSCSFGLKEEIFLCFRIALSDFLYGESLPLIFDDPFLGSDDIREKKLINMLSELSKARQIIVFTNRKNPLYNQINCNFIDISPFYDV